MATPSKAATPSAGSPSPTKEEVESLRTERTRIREALYAEYGDRIDKMMDDAKATPMQMSPAEVRQKRLEAMLDERTPLRQEVKATQNEAIQKLIEHAKESSERGVDVSSRLNLLLNLQEQTRVSERPVRIAD